jgi:hypothetical protein
MGIATHVKRWLACSLMVFSGTVIAQPTPVSTNAQEVERPSAASTNAQEVERPSAASPNAQEIARPSAASPTVESSAPTAAPRRGADGATRQPRSDVWDAWGEARGRFNQSTPFGVDDLGTTAQQRAWVQSRLIAGGRWMPSASLRFELELDALSGFLGGDAMRLGTTYTPRPFQLAPDGQDLVRVIPRKANVLWTTSIGQVSVGAQTFNWGTGLLANDGAGAAQTDGLEFGDSWMGSVVARAAFSTKPFARLTTPLLRDVGVFVAGDFVLRDDNASVFDGDLAGAGVLGARLDTGATALGLLVVGRHQVDRLDPYRPGTTRSFTTVAVTDLYGRQRFDLLDGSQHLTVEGEGTIVAGRSTRPLGDETQNGADVLQFGGLARLRWDVDALKLTSAVEAGYASGDNDPRDRVARAFSMNSDHNVGLVLFDHVLPMVTARTVDRLTAPSLTGTPPASARFLINPGAVQNAAYVHPVVKWRPLDVLELRLGYVYAVAAADVADAWQSAINGGFSATPGGRVQGGRVFGHEFDARVSAHLPLPGGVRVLAGVEGGVLLPGSAFDGVQGLGTPWLARALLSVRW